MRVIKYIRFTIKLFILLLEFEFDHASLFTGIGGFDLAAEWAGFNNVFQVENNPFCNKVLIKNFPNVKRYEDIEKFEGKKYRGSIDIVSGGFPCQPFSHAGKRKGTEDNRNLWPEMLRTIRDIQPSYVVAENVFGLVNWNKGMVFEQVQTDLENEGYQVQSVILPAAGKNAPHKRDRIWIVAYSEHFRNINRSNKIQRKSEKKKMEKQHKIYKFKQPGTIWKFFSNTFSERRCSRKTNSQNAKNAWQSSRGKKSGPWHVEPDVDRVANGVSDRVDKYRAIGNAIVPQIAYEIFMVIKKMEIDAAKQNL